MTSIAANMQAVIGRISRACAAVGRDPRGVALLAVSKTWPVAALREAVAAGQRAFGENYVQEALAKIGALRSLDLEWHFIGPLQGNKTRAVAENFAWVHSVDRLKIAERLSAQRPAGLPPLNVCVEVNVSGEASKSGVMCDEARALCRAVAALMAIPEPTPATDPESAVARRRFAQLRELRDELNADNAGNAGGLGLDTLSMGMSHDMEAAIMEGATIVRVGTAIFGERVKS